MFALANLYPVQKQLCPTEATCLRARRNQDLRRANATESAKRAAAERLDRNFRSFAADLTNLCSELP
jgi:hypothetical protein